MRRSLLLISVLSCLVLGPAGAQEDVVMQAMRDELARSTERLLMEGLERPYFISYRIEERVVTGAEATFGSLVQSELTRNRDLEVEVRVGSPDLDNTNFVTVSFGGRGMMMSRGESGALPLDDSYQEIRRALWLATDAAYKEALEDLSKKRAALQNKTRTEELPDFSTSRRAEVHDPIPGPPPDLERVSALVRDLSLLFRDMPQVSASSVRSRGQNRYTRYCNSEGTSFTRTSSFVSLVARAEGYASDGYPLRDFVAAFGRSLEDLPAQAALAAEIRSMGERLAELQKAPFLEIYNGPVLFEDEAAAEIVAQGFLPSILGARKPVTDNAQYEMLLQGQGGNLADRIGARVLPTFLSLHDDPTLAVLGKVPLMGAYSIDDDGVPAARTPVVEGGTLKTLLGTRNPARGALTSTGNRRGGNAVPSNVILTAKDGLKEKALHKKLLEIAKERGLEFGIVVRRMGNASLTPGESGSMASFIRMFSMGGEETGLEPVIAAYKVYPDGREELVRNVEIGEAGASAFKDIMATSEEPAVFTLPYSSKGPGASLGRMASMFGGERGAPTLVSVVTPDLLFEELTLKKPTGEVPKPPVAGHPFFEK